MSKSIRIRDHLYEEIQRVAERENRPLVRQLEMLLEQALKMGDAGIATITQGDEVVGFALPTPPQERKRNMEALGRDDHFKPDFGKKLK